MMVSQRRQVAARHSFSYALVWGAAVALASSLAFRLIGQWLVVPGDLFRLAVLYAIAVPSAALVTFPLYSLQRIDRSKRAATAILIVLPGMILDIFAVGAFPSFYPNLRTDSVHIFGSWLLWADSLILAFGFIPFPAGSLETQPDLAATRPEVLRLTSRRSVRSPMTRPDDRG